MKWRWNKIYDDHHWIYRSALLSRREECEPCLKMAISHRLRVIVYFSFSRYDARK